MDFTRFFAAAPAPAPVVPAKKRRSTKAKPPPKRRKELPPAPPLPGKYADLLTGYDQLRRVARSLEAMRVKTTLAQLCGAVPQLNLTPETVRTVALACGRALTLEDDVVVFPKLAPVDRKRGPTYEAARRATLEALLRDSCGAAHAAWLARKGLVQADGFHVDFDEGPEVATAPLPPPPSPMKAKPALPTDALEPLQRLSEEDWYEGQAVRIETLAKKPGRYAAVTQPLPESVRKFLEPLRLYAHQARAIDACLSGADVALATGTASGKTLSYAVPALCAAAENEGCVALFLFPTKALAQDQLGALRRAIDACSLQATYATLDGDTPDDERNELAENPSTFLITNPDMLHYTLLPGASSRWRRLFDDLKYVVVDEAHVYVGGFGAHVAAVLRRLQRLVPATQYFACSATIRDASKHVSTLLPPSSRPLVVIDDDCSPRGPKQVVVWNPPLKKGKQFKRKVVEADTDDYDSDTDEYDEKAALVGEEQARALTMLAERKALAVEGEDGEPIRRKSAIVEAARLVAALTTHGVRTLCFCKTRKLQELVLGYAQERCSTRLAGYRGGYTPGERRRVESDFFEGRLDGVVATCALELGVDVGDLDATVHLGWPGSRCSLRQQAGRAGRDPSRASLAVVVLFSSPLDQLMARKAPLLSGEVEPCALSITNERVLRDQLLCAAAEAPLSGEDRKRFVGRRDGAMSQEALKTWAHALDALKRDGSLIEKSGSFVCRRSDVRHAKDVRLRVVDPVTIEVRINGVVLDTVPYARAFYELFEGAVYLHQVHTTSRLPSLSSAVMMIHIVMPMPLAGHSDRWVFQRSLHWCRLLTTAAGAP